MRQFPTLLLVFLLASPALAADVSGQWALNIVDKDATHRQGTCTLIQEGQRLRGTCGPEKGEGLPLQGEINGNDVTWRVERGPAYKAVLDETLTFMKGTFSASGEGIFTAMKTK